MDKVLKLQRTVQGMKTQARYTNHRLKEDEARLEKDEALLFPLPRRIATIEFQCRLLLVSLGCFYATIIIGRVIGI